MPFALHRRAVAREAQVFRPTHAPVPRQPGREAHRRGLGRNVPTGRYAVLAPQSRGSVRATSDALLRGDHGREYGDSVARLACRTILVARVGVRARRYASEGDEVLILHLVTQAGQPYGSVRRCCEKCGIMTEPGPPWGSKFTDDPVVWERTRSERFLAEGVCFTSCSGRDSLPAKGGGE